MGVLQWHLVAIRVRGQLRRLDDRKSGTRTEKCTLKSFRLMQESCKGKKKKKDLQICGALIFSYTWRSRYVIYVLVIC